ncbi:MAG: 30S ribosomal protein S12 methylthiotransferase RimO [Peptococcaceae bacterium]|nr:30S ribosomal protein S12 methylthiotransferase RimO [Peptococcaceae bacterium]
MQKVSILSLGCAKNLVHSETMMGLFQQQGYELTEQYDEAEIIIINTCGFVNAAKEESINAILEMAQWKEQGVCRMLVAVGCLVQKYAQELAAELPEVDIFVGTNDYRQIVEIIRKHEDSQEIVVHTNWTEESKAEQAPRIVTTPKHYAYLRISEGCDNNCTYCVIPEMQGPYRSKTIEQIKEEAVLLAENGATELILVAQDTSYYGKDLYGRFALVDLLKELAAIPQVRWIRLLYAYPNNFDDEMIDYIASEEKICKYLDIPLQHGDDTVLKRMNRKITVEEIKTLIGKLRSRIPDITLRSTFIVGFPGETEEQYHNLLNFLEEMQLDCVGAFPYSREEGTAADRLDGHLEDDEKEKRAENLMDLQYDTMYRKHEQAVGQRRLVKVDELSPDIPGLLLCRSQGEAPDVDPWILVFEAEDHQYQPGDYFTVEITGLDEYDFVGEIVK